MNTALHMRVHADYEAHIFYRIFYLQNGKNIVYCKKRKAVIP